jgi:hypothetical protein
MPREAGLLRAFLIAGPAVAGDCKQRDVRGPLVAAQATRDFIAVDVGESDAAENDLGHALPGRFHAVDPRLCDKRGMPKLVEERPAGRSDIDIVFDQKNPQWFPATGRRVLPATGWSRAGVAVPAARS